MSFKEKYLSNEKCFPSDIQEAKSYFNVNNINDKTPIEKRTALYIACEEGNADYVKLLLDIDGIDVNIIERWGRTPFFSACSNGHIDVVKLLLDFGNKTRSLGNKTRSLGNKTNLDVEWHHHTYYDILFILVRDAYSDVNKYKIAMLLLDYGKKFICNGETFIVDGKTKKYEKCLIYELRFKYSTLSLADILQ